MRQPVRLLLLTVFYMTLPTNTKILRNNALITKMITHFQQDKSLSVSPKRKEESPQINTEHKHVEYVPENQPKQDKILSLMQNVLCRNFPTIPCNIIMQDDALNKLIQRSIQQITYKKLKMDKTTPSPYNPTVFPVINSEDLSNFLEVSNTGFFDEKMSEAQKRKKKKRGGSETKLKNHWSHEKPSKKKIKGSKDNKRGTELYTGRKKMRKFYPHKIKYKDKSKSSRADFRDYTDDKISMSVEMPDVQSAILPPKQEHLTYKEPSDTPMWRIDYIKHGVPSMNNNNMFGFDDERLRGKLVKTGPSNVVLDENGLEQAVMRKEVLHPDVYIKKNYVRKNTAMDSSPLE